MKVHSLTKRGTLNEVTSIFNPLGSLTAFTLKAKVLRQLMSRKTLGWDDEVPQSIPKACNKCLDGIKEINKVQIGKCYHHHGLQCSDILLHIFSDESESAYAAVAYLRFVFKDATTHCRFDMGKSRFAPTGHLQCQDWI